MTKIKICGLSRPADIEIVNQFLPDYIGFIFAKSRRLVSAETAKELKKLLDPRIQAVGVFVNEDIDTIIRLCRCGGSAPADRHNFNGAAGYGVEEADRHDPSEVTGLNLNETIGYGAREEDRYDHNQEVGYDSKEAVGYASDLSEQNTAGRVIDIIQLHGDEDEAYIRRLKAEVSVPIIKAVRVRSSEDIHKAARLPCDFLLLDAYREDQYGGGGEVFDWTQIGRPNKPFFLAGGITPGNVPEAIERARPYGIDVSTGVESNGYKDPAKVKDMITKVRSVR